MKYGFIGCGNMGGAIARALSHKTKDMALSDRSGKAAGLARELGCVYRNNAWIAENCDILFLGVKPHMMQGVLTEIAPTLCQRRPLLVTMAAGLEIRRIEGFVGARLPIIRIMPNTPVAVGKGLTQYCANDLVSQGLLHAFLEDMAATGRLDPLEESLIDAASALSGCGPAYMYIFLEALADGAVACGIPRAKAMEYAAATMAGAAEMYLATRTHPGALKDAVCSPGGSTIAGVKALEQHGFRGAVMDCVAAACSRNKELGKQ